MIKLKNTALEVEIDNMGAELTHVIDQKNNFDYIWNGKAWNRHAPILFPAIGKSNLDEYEVNDKVYPMPQHGFARDFDWQKVNQAENRVLLELKSNPRTKTMFPFDFTLQIEYKLDGNRLSVGYRVMNRSDTVMPYALGSHPAFNLPIDDDGVFEDYELEFAPTPKQVKRLGIDPIPFRDGTKIPFDEVKEGYLNLNHDLFEKGLVILDTHKVNQVTLRSDQTAHEIKMNFKQFPYLTLWTKEDTTEPFLCIEPFAGLPDQYGEQPINWHNKKGNNLLEAHAEQTFEYWIEFK